MTTLIQQRTKSDCVLACIAMAAGVSSWDDLWTQEDADKILGKGISPFDYSEWGERAGLQFDYCSVWNGADMNTIKFLLKGQKVILSVDSLNIDHGSHAIYWDGERLWDPNEGKSDKLAFKYLSSVRITGINRPRPFVKKDLEEKK